MPIWGKEEYHGGDDVHEWLDSLLEEYMTADGFDDAIVGITNPSPNRKPVVVYDQVRCVEILQERDGMTEEEAWEYFEVNVLGSWMGELTPVYLEVFGDVEEED